MTETPDEPGNEPGHEPGSQPGHEPVGTVAEEAAKLLGAMGDWAREHGTPGWVDGLGDGWGVLTHDVNEHLANGEDCRYCPLCRGLQVVRSASPEVREHLASAISSLAQAATTYLSSSPADGRDPGVEHIDVSEDWPEEDA
jgi:hypothetical protein